MLFFSGSIRTEYVSSFFFFFNDTATTEIYTLSLHDALPILMAPAGAEALLTPVADGLVPEDVVLLLLLHAAAAKARTVRTSVILNRPGADLPWFLIFHLFLLGRSSSRAAATRPPRPEPGPRRRIIMELNNRFPMIDVIWRCTRPSSSSERLTTVT